MNTTVKRLCAALNGNACNKPSTESAEHFSL